MWLRMILRIWLSGWGFETLFVGICGCLQKKFFTAKQPRVLEDPAIVRIIPAAGNIGPPSSWPVHHRHGRA